jgi:nicotinate phosphoribosyltransferase
MEYAGTPRFKKSEGKATIPGRKQIFRQFEDKTMVGDVLTVEGDEIEGVPLLAKVMSGGKIISRHQDLKEIAAYTRSQLKSLPAHFQRLETTPPYPVKVSPILSRLGQELERRLGL